jgi:hypothetical protein
VLFFIAIQSHQRLKSGRKSNSPYSTPHGVSIVHSIVAIKNNASKKELTNFYLFACYLKNFVYICAQIKVRKSGTFLIHAETDTGNTELFIERVWICGIYVYINLKL